MDLNTLLLVVAGFSAALMANSTGAGGGIVFIPLFSYLGLDLEESISTSIFIQCFGMSSGTISWLKHTKRGFTLSTLKYALFISVCALIGSYITHQYLRVSNQAIVLTFGILSLTIGALALINWNYFFKLSENNTTHNLPINLLLIGIPGGALTSLISIGVGELVYLYILVIRKNVHEAIMTAVMTTALTVILLFTAGPVDYSPNYNIALPIILGAIIGGYMARYVVHLIGIVSVKKFCAYLIICTGLLELSSLI